MHTEEQLFLYCSYWQVTFKKKKQQYSKLFAATHIDKTTQQFNFHLHYSVSATLGVRK